MTGASRASQLGLAAALTAAVAVTTAWRGGYTDAGRGLVVVLAALALGIAVWQRPDAVARAWRAGPVLVLAALAVVGAISVAWTVGPRGEALRWALVLIALAGLAAAAAALADAETVAWILLLVAVAVAVIGMVGTVASAGRISLDICGTRRPAGPFEYPPALALACVSALPCAVVGGARAGVRWRRLGCAAAGWLLVFTVLVSGSRLEVALAGAALAATAALAPTGDGPTAAVATLVAIAGGASALIVGGELGNDPTWVVLASVVAGLAVVLVLSVVSGRGRRGWWTAAVCLLGAVAIVSASAAERVGGCGYADLTHGRTGIWKAAVRTARERPVVGFGLESFAVASRRQQLRERPIPVRYAHNLPLEAWVELGVVGLALILALFATVVRTTLRARRGIGVLLGPAAIAFLVANLLDWQWHLAGSAAAFAIAVGGLIASAAGRDQVVAVCGTGNARFPRQDLAELDELAVEGGVEGRRERELDRPRRGLRRGLRLAHVVEPRARGVGVDQARAERHDQPVLRQIAGAALAGDGADGRDLRDLADGMFSHVPKPSSSARPSRTAWRHSSTSASTASRSCGRRGGEAVGDAVVELVERAQRAGDHDQPAAGAQARRERPQHARSSRGCWSRRSRRSGRRDRRRASCARWRWRTRCRPRRARRPVRRWRRRRGRRARGPRRERSLGRRRPRPRRRGRARGRGR